MANIANHMRVRLKHHVSTLNGPLNPAIHDHLFSGNAPDNLGLGRNDKRCAMQITLYLTIDLN